MIKPQNYKDYTLIIDSSTLIILGELGAGNLLDKLREEGQFEVIIPDAVIKEFERAGISVRPLDDPPPAKINYLEYSDILLSLGEGEREAIGIALTLKEKSLSTPIVITDDKKAREISRRLGIRVHGTLGLIEIAKTSRIISKQDAIELIHRIPRTSLYITMDIIRDIEERIKKQNIT